jgi:hypothetical protein
LFEPPTLGLSKLLDLFSTFGSAEDGQEGNDQDVEQGMAFAAVDAGIRQVGKVRDESR